MLQVVNHFFNHLFIFLGLVHGCFLLGKHVFSSTASRHQIGTFADVVLADAIVKNISGRTISVFRDFSRGMIRNSWAKHMEVCSSENGGSPIAGWFIIKHPIEMDDDWGYPHFRKPPYGNNVGMVKQR